MSTSSPPRRSIASATARSTDSWSRTSQAMIGRRRRSGPGPTTRAPRARSSAAAAAPMPLAAPVMSTRALMRHRSRATARRGRAGRARSRPGRTRRPLAEAARPVGPQRRVAAGLVEVPARAAGVPHRALHALVELGVVALGVGADLDTSPRRARPSRAARRSRRRSATRSCRPSTCGRGRCSGRAAGTGWGSRRPPCRGRPAGCPARPRRAYGRRGRAPASPTGMSVTWKPVPKMIASTSRSLAVAGDDRVAA